MSKYSTDYITSSLSWLHHSRNHNHRRPPTLYGGRRPRVEIESGNNEDARQKETTRALKTVRATDRASEKREHSFDCHCRHTATATRNR